MDDPQEKLSSFHISTFFFFFTSNGVSFSHCIMRSIENASRETCINSIFVRNVEVLRKRIPTLPFHRTHSFNNCIILGDNKDYLSTSFPLDFPFNFHTLFSQCLIGHFSMLVSEIVMPVEQKISLNWAWDRGTYILSIFTGNQIDGKLNYN